MTLKTISGKSAERSLLLLIAVIIATACQPELDNLPAPLESSVLPALGVQLWSVRDILEQDFDGTLSQLAKAGFRGVEFAQVFGPYVNDPAGLRATLLQLGLVPSGAHVVFDDLTTRRIKHTVLFYRTIGTRHLTIAWDPRAWDPKKIDALIGDLNRAAEYLAEFDMTLGFHHHDKEFAPFRDSTYWHHIADNTDPSVRLQIDYGWLAVAGVDPVELTKQYRDRIASVHLKTIPAADRQEQSPILGQDNTEWQRLIDIVTKNGNADWLVIEQQVIPQGMTSLEAVIASKTGIEKVIPASATR